MSTASQMFNDLPYGQRLIVVPVLIEAQILQIRRDQETATVAHRKFMKETNDHLRNLEKSLAELTAALTRDDAAEDRGMHGDDRLTCWQCQSWADHAHHPLSNRRMSLDEWSDYRAERGF
jgi:hypothetical protein